jgi:predicted DNA binding CopG/RHH family protein
MGVHMHKKNPRISQERMTNNNENYQITDAKAQRSINRINTAHTHTNKHITHFLRCIILKMLKSKFQEKILKEQKEIKNAFA